MKQMLMMNTILLLVMVRYILVLFYGHKTVPKRILLLYHKIIYIINFKKLL